MVIQGINYPSDFEAKKGMIEIGRRLGEKGCVIADDGSLSVRVGPNAVWITAEGTDKGALKQESFIRVDLNGKQLPGSRQARLPEDVTAHLKIYNQNPMLHAVLHVYPAEAVVLTAAGKSVPPVDYTPALRKLGRISLVPAGSAEALERAVPMACKTDSGVLLAGDGCMMWGESLLEAFHRMEALEYYAKVSRLLDTPVPENDCFSQYTEAATGQGKPVSFEMDGLTPVIRPGETLQASKKTQEAAVSGLAAAMPSAAVFGTATTAAVPSAADRSAAVPPMNPQVKKREEMMAEVVRRSLAALR